MHTFNHGGLKPSHTPQILLIILEITNGKKNWWRIEPPCTLGDAKNQNLTWNYKFNFLAFINQKFHFRIFILFIIIILGLFVFCYFSCTLSMFSFICILSFVLHSFNAFFFYLFDLIVNFSSETFI
jgi:hypothetical protein